MVSSFWCFQFFRYWQNRCLARCLQRTLVGTSINFFFLHQRSIHFPFCFSYFGSHKHWIPVTSNILAVKRIAFMCKSNIPGSDLNSGGHHNKGLPVAPKPRAVAFFVEISTLHNKGTKPAKSKPTAFWVDPMQTNADAFCCRLPLPRDLATPCTIYVQSWGPQCSFRLWWCTVHAVSSFLKRYLTII